MRKTFWTDALSATQSMAARLHVHPEEMSSPYDLTVKNYMKVKQLSWHTCGNQQPTSIPPEKHWAAVWPEGLSNGSRKAAWVLQDLAGI